MRKLWHMANEQSQNERGEYQIDEITYTRGATLNAYKCVQRGGRRPEGGRGALLKIGHKIHTY